MTNIKWNFASNFRYFIAKMYKMTFDCYINPALISNPRPNGFKIFDENTNLFRLSHILRVSSSPSGQSSWSSHTHDLGIQVRLKIEFTGLEDL